MGPALKRPGLAAAGRDLAERQTVIHRRLGRLAGMDLPPPSSEWRIYRSDMAALIAQQAEPDTGGGRPGRGHAGHGRPDTGGRSGSGIPDDCRPKSPSRFPSAWCT